MKRIKKIFSFIFCGMIVFLLLTSCSMSSENTEETNISPSIDPSKSYSVTYLDEDGVVLKEATVYHGANAETLFVPVRRGYRFIGWDQPCDIVTKDITVKAKYEIAKNQLFFSYDENADAVTATLSIEGDVCACGFETYISYQTSNMDLTGVSVHTPDGIEINFSEINDTVYVYFNDENCKNITTNFDIITFTFQKRKEPAYVKFVLKDIDIFDEIYNDCEYYVENMEYRSNQ